MPTALITGATGLLGRAVHDAFSRRSDWTSIGTGLTRAEPPQYRKLDLLDEKAVTECLEEIKPQVVVHCAADRSPDSCAADPARAHNLNVTSTALLSALCNHHSILLIYISTDYVFAGTPGEAPYAASATTQPTNIYGEMKYAGENSVQPGNDDIRDCGFVLRVPVLYGRCSPRTNYAESAVNCLVDAVYKAQEPINSKSDSESKKLVVMDDWAQRYPTATEDVARVCVDLSTKYLDTSREERKTWPHILQFSAEERMTKYEMCEVLAEILGLPLEGGMVPNKHGNDPHAKVQRPYDTHLSTEELKGIGIDVSCVSFRDWWKRELGAFRK